MTGGSEWQLRDSTPADRRDAALLTLLMEVSLVMVAGKSEELPRLAAVQRSYLAWFHVAGVQPPVWCGMYTTVSG